MATLFLAIWIVIPAPNRTLLPLSVGAPEISVWLILSATVAIIGAVRTWHMHIIAKVATVASVIALILDNSNRSLPFGCFAYDQRVAINVGRRLSRCGAV